MAKIELLKISIDESKLEMFRVPFLKFKPMPLDAEGSPTMTEKEWFKKCVVIHLMWAYKNGADLLALEQGNAETDILE